MMSKRVSVYGKKADGEMYLIKYKVSLEEGKRLADDYWRSTGRSAVIVYTALEGMEQQ